MDDFTSIPEAAYFAKAGPLPEDMTITEQDCKLYWNLLRNRLQASLDDCIDMEIRFLETFCK